MGHGCYCRRRGAVPQSEQQEVFGVRIAIVTGASSGMGREFVRALDARGGLDEIWAVARGQEGLDALRAQTKTPVRTLPLDLGQEEAYAHIAALLEAQKPAVAYLVNNAGFGKFCPLEDLSLEQTLSMVDVNCRAVAALCRVCLPYLAPGSRVLNLSSASAFQPLPYMELYAASKVFVRYLSRGLNRELKERGVCVTAVCPYWTKTAFFDRAHDHAGKKRITKYEVLYDPAKVVQKALRDAQKGRDMSVYGLWNRCQHVLTKLLPQSFVMTQWQRRQGL